MSRSLASRSCVTGWSPAHKKVSWRQPDNWPLVCDGWKSGFYAICKCLPRCLSPGLIAARLLLSVSICSEECNWVGLIKYIVRLYQCGRERVGPLHCSAPPFSCHLHDLQLIFQAQPSNFATTMIHSKWFILESKMSAIIVKERKRPNSKMFYS